MIPIQLPYRFRPIGFDFVGSVMTVAVHADGAQRRDYIDFLRGVAILLVIGGYSCGILSSTFYAKICLWVRHSGIAPFFIASAFLVARRHERSSDADVEKCASQMWAKSSPLPDP